MGDSPRDIPIIGDNPTDAEPMVRALRRASLANPATVGEDGAEALDHLFGKGKHVGRPNGEAPGSTSRRGGAGA